ncbi:MAG: malectin domain-containing carbohydrate-binding protein, partial [Ilumatobacteraceae bacterium]
MQVASDTLAGTTVNWVDSYPLTIANEATGDRPWLGTLCLVAIYDDALDATEVANNYNAGCDLPTPAPEALVQVTPGGGLGATTFGNSTITVTNTGAPGSPTITDVEFDLGGSLIPDATFDPVGTAGDEGTQCLEVSSEGGTGYIVPVDNCTDPFSLPHEDDPGVPGNGYDGMALGFSDFAAGEAIVFGVDVDPTTIQGVPGAGGAGAVSGLELSGSTVTVTFSDGQVLTNQIFGDGSDGGGQAVLRPRTETAVLSGIELLGASATPTVFLNDSKVVVVPSVGPQTVQVSGPVGSSVTLLAVDGALQSPAPFDPDPYESDAVVAVDYLTGTIGAGGTVDFEVAIDSAAVLHHFVATIDDGETGPLSEKLIVAVDSPSGAVVQVTPNSGIDASTFTNGTMSITNSGSVGDGNIASVEFDLRGSIIPDATFDPNGVAGDTVPKCLVVSSGGAATGYVTPADNCNDPFAVPHEDEPGVAGLGYDVMTLDFTDFGPGESISFAVDIDATTIQGFVGSGGAGSVSGLELTGSLITVVFDNGAAQSTAFSQLFGDGSAGGGIAVVDSTTDVLAPPAIEMVGVSTQPTVFTNGSEVGSVPATGPQTVRVTGTEGDSVTLLEMTGDVVTSPAFDLDEFESDTAIAVDYFPAVVGPGGFVDIPVDIAQNDVLYHYTAIIGDGSEGASTQLVIGVSLDVDTPVIQPIDNVLVDIGDTVSVAVDSTSTSADPIVLSIASVPDIVDLGATLTDNGDGSGSIGWDTTGVPAGTYVVDVTATAGALSSTESFSIVVNDPNVVETVLYRVNAGGPQVVDPNGGPAWTEDQPTAGVGGTATTGTPSAYLVASSNNAFGVAGAIDLSHPSVPAGTPQELFQVERYDADAATPMVYEFPVGAGQAYELDLYFAETFATAAGVRQFTVDVEGTEFLIDYDIYELVGGFAGIVETITTP